MKNPENLKILVSIKRQQFGARDDYLKFHTSMVTANPGEDIKYVYGSAFGPEYECAYEKLSVTAQLDPSSTNFYGTKICYRDLSDLDVHEAQIKAKTLKRIDTNMERLRNKFGYPEDLTRFLAYFASAVGLDENDFLTLEDREYRHRSLSSVDCYIKQSINQWRKDRGE